jgi:hypothetical protein
MRDLEKRISYLEKTQRLSHVEEHWIPVLFYPWELPDDTRKTWLAEQIRCACSPEWSGKRVGSLLLEEAPTAEAWAERYRQYARERMSDER